MMTNGTITTGATTLRDTDNLLYNCYVHDPIIILKDITKSPKVKDVNIIVPDKVVEVIFDDGSKEKSVCREPDVFSLETAISICISKKIMGGSSAYNNAIKRGMKVYENKLKKEASDKAEKERIEKRRAKRQAYKERKAAKKREEAIEIQKEAYIRAMEHMKNEEAAV